MNGILIYVNGSRKHNVTHNKQFNSTANESIFGGSAFMKLTLQDKLWIFVLMQLEQLH